jgi:hypothetical protein
MVTLAREDPVASTLVATIRGGDLEGLERLLREHPGLAAARIADDQGGSRTMLGNGLTGRVARSRMVGRRSCADGGGCCFS